MLTNNLRTQTIKNDFNFIWYIKLRVHFIYGKIHQFKTVHNILIVRKMIKLRIETQKL